MMLFSLLINNYGAKIDKKIGNANFKAVKLKNVGVFLLHCDILMPKWHEIIAFLDFWHMLCYPFFGLLSILTSESTKGWRKPRNINENY